MKDNEEAALIKFVSEMTLEDCPANTVIFKENDPSNNKMYIVQDGYVSILKEEQKNVFEDDFQKFLDQKNNNSRVPIASTPIAEKVDNSSSDSFKVPNMISLLTNKVKNIKDTLNAETTHQITKAPILEEINEGEVDISQEVEDSGTKNEEVEEKEWIDQMQDQYGPKIVEQKKGYMFGELALLNTKPRGATILSEVDCRFLVLAKKQFDFIKKFYSSEMVFKREFLFNVMPKLDEINADKYVTDILINFANVGYTKGTVVAKQNLVGERIYFLKTGICKIQYRLPSKKVITICEITSGTVIGEECLFNMDNKYTFTAVVHSQEAKFLTLYRRYMQKSIPFSTLEDLKSSYDMKDKARMNYIKKMAVDNDLAEILDAKSRIFVKDPLMGINRRKPQKKLELKEQVPIETTIEHRKYFQVNFQRFQNLEEQKWSLGMMNKSNKKKNTDGELLDLETVQNWRKEQQIRDPQGFKQHCEDMAIRFSAEKKPTFDIGVQEEKKDEDIRSIAKAQVQVDQEEDKSDDCPLWNLDGKDIFDEPPEKKRPKNYTTIDKKYKEVKQVNFIAQPDVGNILQKRARNIKSITGSCNQLPEYDQYGNVSKSIILNDKRNFNKTLNFIVRDGSPLKKPKQNLSKTLASLNFTEANGGQDMMNVSPLMKPATNYSENSIYKNFQETKYTSIQEFGIKTCQASELGLPNNKPETEAYLNFEYNNPVTLPMVKPVGGQSTATISKSMINMKKTIKSKTCAINVFDQFGRSPIQTTDIVTGCSLDNGKQLGSPFQDQVTSQRYDLLKTGTSNNEIGGDLVICTKAMREKIYGNGQNISLYENRLHAKRKNIANTEPYTKDYSKKNNMSLNSFSLVEKKGNTVKAAKLNNKTGIVSTSRFINFDDPKKLPSGSRINNVSSALNKPDVSNNDDQSLAQKYDSIKNNKLNHHKSPRRISTSIINTPMSERVGDREKKVGTKLEEAPIIIENMKKERGSKTESKTIPRLNGSQCKNNDFDLGITSSITSNKHMDSSLKKSKTSNIHIGSGVGNSKTSNRCIDTGVRNSKNINKYKDFGFRSCTNKIESQGMNMLVGKNDILYNGHVTKKTIDIEDKKKLVSAKKMDSEDDKNSIFPVSQQQKKRISYRDDNNNKKSEPRFDGQNKNESLKTFIHRKSVEWRSSDKGSNSLAK